MDPKQAHELVDRYLRAAAAQDFDDLREVFADDVAVEWPQSGEHFRGKDACVNIYANYPGGSPALISLDRVLGEGDFWTVEAQLMYPGEKRYMLASIIQTSGGKVVHEIDYFAEPFPVPEWRKDLAAG